MRKTSLYGARIQGDLELGTEPTRLDGAGVASWARMDFPGKRLAGQSDQLITATSVTQKFEIGTRRIEYGRTFRYSKAGATTTTASHAFLLANANYVPDAASHEDEDGFYGDLLTAAVIGDTYLDLEETAAARPANYYQGGYVTIFDGNYNTYYVVKSDASTATYTRIYLDHPLVQNVSATNGIEVHLSPYCNVIDGVMVGTWMSFIGRAHCGEITSGHYFWLQTAGPAWVTPTDWSTQCPGYASYKRDVYANVDGSVCLQVTTGSRQRVGYLLAATEANYGSVFIMLQLE